MKQIAIGLAFCLFAGQVVAEEADQANYELLDPEYWIFDRDPDSRALSFNMPWGAEPGDKIVRDQDQAPAYAVDCVKQARELIPETLDRSEIQQHFTAVLDNGATNRILIQVNAIGTSLPGDVEFLQRLDRSNYFWHWNGGNERPDLSMSRFDEGKWVWEIVASEDRGCFHPSLNEMTRYLQYVNRRLTASHLSERSGT